MSSKPWSGSSRKQRVNDVLKSIDAINSYLSGITEAAFVADRKTVSAVEREILIISEAMSKLVELEAQLPEEHQFQTRFPEIPVHQIRGMGNVLRHEYGRANPIVAWETATGGSLANLKAALEEY